MENLKFRKGKNSGITLIALIVTIVVLLILAGITISSLTGSDSAPAKANEANQKNAIGTARDDVYLTAQNAQMEAYQTAYVENGVSAGEASTTVGTYVRTKLNEKYGTDGNFKTGLATITSTTTGNIEISTTDFVIEGNIADKGGNLTWGEIEPNVPRISGVPSTYELNTGESFTIPAILKGTKNNIDIEWSSSNSSIATVTNGVVTAATNLIIDEQTVNTAQVTITVSATGCESKVCTITVNKIMTAKDILTINPSATKAEEKSPYVIYKAAKNIDDTTNGETNEILCRVLYNDDTHGLQLISVNPVTDVTLGANDPNYVTASSTDLEEAQNSYNHAIVNLNNKAEEYLANDGIAVDARCVGSLATISSTTKKFDKKDNPDNLVEDIENPTDEEKNAYMFSTSSYYYPNSYNGKYFNTDSNYTDDENRLTSSGGIDAYKITKKSDGTNVSSSDSYWLASRMIQYASAANAHYIGLKTQKASGNDRRYGSLLIAVHDNVYSSSTAEKGFRPVFLLDSNVKLTGAGENLGSESNPYGLTK